MTLEAQGLMKLEFSQGVLKNAQIQNVIKTRLVGVELFHADGRTERHT
jgi:hypothetical protein